MALSCPACRSPEVSVELDCIHCLSCSGYFQLDGTPRHPDPNWQGEEWVPAGHHDPAYDHVHDHPHGDEPVETPEESPPEPTPEEAPSGEADGGQEESNPEEPDGGAVEGQEQG